MSRILALALASAPVLVSASPPQGPDTSATEKTMPSPFRGSFETVPKVECRFGTGSGVRVSDDIVITAAHVTSKNAPCGIDGVPVEVVYQEPGIDFVALKADLGVGLRAIVSCEGVIAGQRYYAYGYAHGGKANMEPLIGTNLNLPNGRVQLRGRVFPGMSGGMVTNEEGAFVAVTVQYNREVDHAYVVDLRNTYLCRN